MNINLDFDNPSVRLPLALVLDTSGSMEWGNPKPIDLLNQGLRTLKEEIENDEIAMMALELSMVNCGEEVKEINQFDNIYNIDIPELQASGGTPLGESVELALEKLDERKKLYKKNGVQYYQPMLLIMTDGFATDYTANAVKKVKDKVKDKKLTVVNIAIGDSADLDTLKSFHPNNEVTVIEKMEIDKLFKWLSESVRVVSSSTADKQLESFNEWKKN